MILSNCCKVLGLTNSVDAAELEQLILDNPEHLENEWLSDEEIAEKLNSPLSLVSEYDNDSATRELDLSILEEQEPARRSDSYINKAQMFNHSRPVVRPTARITLWDVVGRLTPVIHMAVVLVMVSAFANGMTFEKGKEELSKLSISKLISKF